MPHESSLAFPRKSHSVRDRNRVNIPFWTQERVRAFWAQKRVVHFGHKRESSLFGHNLYSFFWAKKRLTNFGPKGDSLSFGLFVYSLILGDTEGVLSSLCAKFGEKESGSRKRKPNISLGAIGSGERLGEEGAAT